MAHYDYIIAGGGAAGLSLVYHLGQAGLLDRKVLLVDPVRKGANDRTWCFWEAEPGPFEAALARSWDHLWIHGDGGSRRLPIGPYRYKMLEAGAFYRFMDAWLAERPGVTRLQGRVSAIEERAGGVAVSVDGQTYTGDWAFSSILSPEPTPPGYVTLLQHFKGWVIRSPTPVFDPGAATFMDFRVEQGRDTRFFYVLPYDAHTALVEDTYFSPAVLPQEVYDQGLRRYIAVQLGLSSYELVHEEFGVIPMTDRPFPRRPSPHVIMIGTAGGMTKASTGYTFQRIQQQSRRIAAGLRATGSPVYAEPAVKRHALMDSVLLNVLDSGRESGKRFFQQLFGRNSIQRVLRFLDEESSLAEDLALMATVNIPAFTVATVDVAARRARVALDQLAVARSRS